MSITFNRRSRSTTSLSSFAVSSFFIPEEIPRDKVFVLLKSLPRQCSKLNSESTLQPVVSALVRRERVILARKVGLGWAVFLLSPFSSSAHQKSVFVSRLNE